MQMLVSAIPRRQKRITGINVSDTGGAGIRRGKKTLFNTEGIIITGGTATYSRHFDYCLRDSDGDIPPEEEASF